MNILIVANHYAVCSARYAADAFTRLGHMVRHVGQPMGRNIWGMQVPQEYVWEPSFPGFFGQDEDASSYDVIIYMDSDPLVLNSHPVEKHATPLVVWGVDNHVRDYRRPYFDHYFLAHRSVSVMDWREPVTLGGKPYGLHMNEPATDMTWLPCAYDPIAFPPSPIPWEQRAYDVCMIGVLYPKRQVLIDALKRTGLKILAGTGLVYENYAAAYQNSRVSLCASARGDLAIRIFETGGMGCAVLSDPLGDLKAYPNHPITEYHSVEEAVELARSLQNRPEVGAACAAWVKPETWDKRANAIVEWYNKRN